MQRIMLYALKTAGGSSSAVPLNMNVDGEILTST